MSGGKTKALLMGLAMKLRPCLPQGFIDSLGQWITGFRPEPDFEIFDDLAETRGFCLDVGANRGHSAISVLRHTRRMQVLSIEPNKVYRWSLLLIGILHPWRFRFRLLAAGDRQSQETLYVPGTSYSDLDAQGSLDVSEFDRTLVRGRLAEDGFDAGDKSAFRKIEVPVIPLDSLGLSPGLVKIDVEGYEFQTLTGLSETLQRHRPALLIELNNPKRWMPFLQELGYGFYFYDSATRSLGRFNETPGVLNLICLHNGNNSEITRILLKKVVA